MAATSTTETSKVRTDWSFGVNNTGSFNRAGDSLVKALL